MTRTRIVLPIAALLLIAGMAGAQSVSGFCSAFFSSSSPVAIPGTSSYAGSVAAIAFLVVLVVLVIIGIAYAIGYAFGIGSLLKFVKSEAVESFFNLIIIAFVAFGIGFAGPAIQFLSALGGITLQSGGAAPSAGNAQQLYTTLCNYYVHDGVVMLIDNSITLTLTYIVVSALQGLFVSLSPNYFGVTYSPFYGASMLLNVLNVQMETYTFFAAILVAMAMLLALIYFLFPFFLYAGVLLRAFPWTRAAGGSLIALFIAFYIVFPALLYPFAIYMSSSITTASQSLYSINPFSSLQTSIAAIFGYVSGSTLVSEVMGPGGFAQNVGMLALQVIGIFVAFLVSFDLLEVLGDLLGSPSLQPNKLFSKVI